MLIIGFLWLGLLTVAIIYQLNKHTITSKDFDVQDKDR